MARTDKPGRNAETDPSSATAGPAKNLDRRAALAAKGGKPDRLMIDTTHLKAHRTAASLLKKGLFPDVSGGPKAA